MPYGKKIIERIVSESGIRPMNPDEFMLLFGEPNRKHASDLILDKLAMPGFWWTYYQVWRQINAEYSFECVNGKRIPIRRNGDCPLDNTAKVFTMVSEHCKE